MKQVWYSSNPDMKSPDTVHQILMFGTLSDIKSLEKRLGKKTIGQLFLRYPKKIYTNTSLNFIKNFVLNINTPIDDQKYLKNTPRNIRQ
ncbi:MAG: hypothetical protein Q8P10_01590 [bacterium]|nr:hypothetical protein [bacterium]